ncbi:hypothetical protein EGR_08239 [Echinococcus granulosus]|uniref:Uncharacterized protein n=1 Tax=Echinococcus granulosus TaxID=6210 RepID=W6UFG9_ECHGR|nr:hypothetical protein EGR_08239 [Echinococcus granulosus]EUB56887.1 hypothetical protein EGR_08239 [Echinococcus granulosus]
MSKIVLKKRHNVMDSNTGLCRLFTRFSERLNRLHERKQSLAIALNIITISPHQPSILIDAALCLTLSSSSSLSFYFGIILFSDIFDNFDSPLCIRAFTALSVVERLPDPDLLIDKKSAVQQMNPSGRWIKLHHFNKSEDVDYIKSGEALADGS